ncbi:MAG: hypothetical protein RIT04_415 [Candidatus Parcubacteria bacterium]|jgi:hypothetical protein
MNISLLKNIFRSITLTLFSVCALFFVVNVQFVHAAEPLSTFYNYMGDYNWYNLDNWDYPVIPDINEPDTKSAVIAADVCVGAVPPTVQDLTFVAGGSWGSCGDGSDINVQGDLVFESGGRMYGDTIHPYNITTIYSGAALEGGSLLQADTVEVLDGASIAPYIEPININFHGSASFYGTISGGVVNFYDTSVNYGTIPATAFSDNSQNAGTIYSGTFYASSSNNGGSIGVGGATFVGDLTEYIPGSATGGELVRTYNSAISPTRSFIENEPAVEWTVVADGAVVNLSGATCGPNVGLSAINGGSFVFGGDCPPGPDGISITTPSSNSTVLTWAPLVNWNQGSNGGYTYDSCQYSYGQLADWDANAVDWVNPSPSYGQWRGASCTLNGSDFIAPTSSTSSQIMVIRAFYASIATSSLVSFTYTPSENLYFYNSGSDSAWTTTSNWYSDSAHTTHVSRIPRAGDKVTVVGSTAPAVDLATWVQPSLINAGSVGITFTSATDASSTVPINGRVTYNGSAKNNGLITGTVTFNDTASNVGTIRGSVVLNDSASNTGSITGNVRFNENTATTTGTISGIKTRYYTATTTTTYNFSGWTVVADAAQVDISGASYASSTILRTLNGGSFVGGPTPVYWYSEGVDTAWSTVTNWYSDNSTSTPLGRLPYGSETVVTLGSYAPTIDLATSSWVTPAGIDASRTGLGITSATTKHIETGITGTTTITGAVINDGYIIGNTTISNTSSNTGTIAGSVSFYNTATNNGGVIIGDAAFYDSTFNTNSSSITGDVTFYNSSYNASSAGYISGLSIFNDSTRNLGTISGDARFVGDYASSSSGTVSGVKTRYYNSATTTVRDFVTTGPWTVVADGAVVTMANASAFSTTTTTFTTLNGGSFVGEGLPGTTTCTKSLFYPGTYTLSADINVACDIQSDGVIIDAQTHTVESTLLAFPNSTSSGGWFDMTNARSLFHMNDVSFVTGAYDSITTLTSTSMGTGITSVTGKIGNALHLNGSGYIQLDGPSAWNVTSGQNLTISFWVNPDSTPASTALMVQRDPISFQLYADWQDSGPWFMFGGATCSFGSALTANTWTLLTVTYNGTAIKTYRNGSLISTCNQSSAMNFGANTHTVIGTDFFGHNFIGAIDEVVLLSRQITAGEVSSIYSSQGASSAIVGNGFDFDLKNLNTTGSIISHGATINISTSTIGMVSVSGMDAVGNAENGGNLNLYNTTAGDLYANGGNSTDYGYGGAAGDITISSGSTYSTQTANAGTNGPNLGSGQQTGGSGSSGGSSRSGCTDPSASNYNSLATVDNGSCRYSSLVVRGCTDPGATNYNSSATISNGSCTYPTISIRSSSSGSSGNSNNSGGDTGSGTSGGTNALTRIAIRAAILNALHLNALPVFNASIGSIGDTVLGNPLADIQILGGLKLSPISLSFGLPISKFLFAPLPKSVTDAIGKSPKLSNMIASVGLVYAQDLAGLEKKPIALSTTEIRETPGLFRVSVGTTTYKTYLSRDAGHEIIQLVRMNQGEIFNIDITPMSTGDVTGMFSDKKFNFFKTPYKTVTATLTAPLEPGRYYITTKASPIPLAIDIVAPQPPPVAPPPLPWWKRVVQWVVGA